MNSTDPTLPLPYSPVPCGMSPQSTRRSNSPKPKHPLFVCAVGTVAAMLFGSAVSTATGAAIAGPSQVFTQTFTTLAPPRSTYTYASDISGNTVVGNYNERVGNNTQQHGFIYDGSTYRNLDFPGALHTYPSGISGGTIVGSYNDSGGRTVITEGTRRRHGFIYDGSTFTTLDFPEATNTELYDVSGSTVVGRYGGPNGAGAFIYDGSSFTTLVGRQGSVYPYGISGSTVVGSSSDSFGEFHGFTAQVPEPASAMLLAIAGVGLLARRTGRRVPAQTFQPCGSAEPLSRNQPPSRLSKNDGLAPLRRWSG